MKTKIVLCGTNYGASYLPAIAGDGSAFDLGGIFARGSDRSKDLAKQKGVPFWSNVEDIDRDVRAAIIALPPSASQDVAKGLIARGIHLLVEHPIWQNDYFELCDLAKQAQTIVHVNCHFGELSAPRAFIEECRRRSQINKPEYASIVVAPRSAYATFDLMGRALGAIDGSVLELESASPTYPFVSFRGTLAGDIVVRVQCSKSLGSVDDGSDSPVPQRIEVGFEDGNLVLASPVGPVIWSEKLRLALRNHPGPLFTMLHERAPTFGELVKERIEANGRTLAELRARIDGGPEPMHQEASWLLRVAELAHTVRTHTEARSDS